MKKIKDYYFSEQHDHVQYLNAGKIKKREKSVCIVQGFTIDNNGFKTFDAQKFPCTPQEYDDWKYLDKYEEYEIDYKTYRKQVFQYIFEDYKK